MSQLPKDLLEILACPRCRGPLAVELESLRCDACRLRYRVDNGIPVMLIHEAEHLDAAGSVDSVGETSPAG
jgi:uncharacterized protein